MRVAAPYCNDDTYIEAIVCSLTDRLVSVDFEPEVIVASFHGMPLETQIKADRHRDQCHKTADLVRLRLGLPRNHPIVTFQSRFRRAEWLKPYTDETIKAHVARGIRRIAVTTPGFSVGCLETIEEIFFAVSG